MKQLASSQNRASSSSNKSTCDGEACQNLPMLHLEGLCTMCSWLVKLNILMHRQVSHCSLLPLQPQWFTGLLGNCHVAAAPALGTFSACSVNAQVADQLMIKDMLWQSCASRHANAAPLCRGSDSLSIYIPSLSAQPTLQYKQLRLS